MVNPADREDELVEVLAGMDPLKIRMAHDLLAEAGVESFVFDEESARMLGSTPAVPARLMVRAAQRDQALEQLKSLGFED